MSVGDYSLQSPHLERLLLETDGRYLSTNFFARNEDYLISLELSDLRGSCVLLLASYLFSKLLLLTPLST